MSVPLTFWHKVKIFRMWLKQQNGGVIINCAYCKSKNIKFDNQLTYDVVHPKKSKKEFKKTKEYTSLYTCLDCGATCDNKQIWSKE